MTTRSQASSDHTRRCAEFEERLPAWLEGQLDDAERSVMEQHHEGCVSCAMLVADLEEIVESAKSLPALTPSRDLWSGIETRLAAPVIPLASRRDATDRVASAPAEGRIRRTGVSVRWFAVAATMLIALSSGITWTVARARLGAPVASAPAGVVASVLPSSGAAGPVASAGAPPVAVPVAVPARGDTANAPASTGGASVPALASGDTQARDTRSGGATAARAVVFQAASSMSDVDAIYEKEIAALRQIVNQRFAELDSATVTALRRNLETIDQAIEDSRRALQRDPRSGLLSTELDRTLEAKLALMRRVALL